MCAQAAARPPIEVMRPTAAAEIPAQGDDRDVWQYSVKVDGFRCVAFAPVAGGPVVLQSRSGRDLSPDFPTLAAAVAASLPAGSVVDGEVCAWAGGRLAFEELLRSRTARERNGVALSYIAFDALAVPAADGEGARDVRGWPLRRRWQALEDLLDGVEPPIERVLATTDHTTATRWSRDLVPAGVEGIVARQLASIYRPGFARSWVKVRHADTEDVQAVALSGSTRRPVAVLVELADGRRVMTSPRLTPLQARLLADAVAGRLGEPVDDREHGLLHPLATPLPAEVAVRSGRHSTIRWVRLR